MTVASFAFLGFAAAAAILFWLARPVWWRQGVLLLANLAFLATFTSSAMSTLPFLLFIAAGYAAIRFVQTENGRRYFVAILICAVAAFFWLKKYTFVPSGLFLTMPYLTIGLSYLFFRMMHMLIDAASGDLKDRIGVVPYFNYLTNFTSLISGPIQRYPDYAKTMLTPWQPRLDWPTVGVALERIVIGFFKVVVLAAILSGIHQRGLELLGSDIGLVERVRDGLLALVGYTFYLYCNFSGYTDIVIGVARFFGIELPENFNRPFSAPSFIEFWGRWHITLSNWLKFYVYNPLVKTLMSRFPSQKVEPYLGVFAFFVTFFLIGLWHGQSSKFAVYGLLLGLGVSINKLHQIIMAKRLGKKRYRALTAHPLYVAVARGLTFTYFTLSLIFFWAEWTDIDMLMRTLGVAGLVGVTLATWAGATLILPITEFGPWLNEQAPVLRSRYLRTSFATAMATVTVGALTLMATPAPDIIYKNF